MKVELLKVADIPATGTKIVPFFGRELHVYISHGKPKAIANTCAHIAGPLECKDGHFVCPWHGATYDLDSGERTGGPAPRGSRLMTVPTRVEGDGLFYVWEE